MVGLKIKEYHSPLVHTHAYTAIRHAYQKSPDFTGYDDLETDDESL